MDHERLLDGCCETGWRLLSAGAEIYRVEETVRRILSAYAVEGDVFAIPGCLIVSFTDEEGVSHTRMRRSDDEAATDIETIERFNALSRAVCANPPAPEHLEALARNTADSCRRYSLPAVLLGCFLGAFFFTFLFQGGLSEALAAGLAGLLSGACARWLERLRVNFFFKTIASAFVLGAFVCSARALGAPIHVGVTMIGGVMVLVPGLVFTNFMCDLITGDTFSGASSLVRALLTAAAIAVGSGAALALFQGLGVTARDAAPALPYPPAVQCATAFLACGGFCLMYNVHGGGIVLCCLGGALGWGVVQAAELVTDSRYLRYFLAAVAISVYAQVMARLRKYPITAYLVVSYFPLVPGSFIYYAMYYAIQGERELCLESGIAALGLAACIAMGSLLVSTTVRTWAGRRGGRRGYHAQV